MKKIIHWLACLLFGCSTVPTYAPRQPVPAETECRFSLSGCESDANDECGYDGYTVLGSYRTQGVLRTPYYHMKYVCNPRR